MILKGIKRLSAQFASFTALLVAFYGGHAVTAETSKERPSGMGLNAYIHQLVPSCADQESPAFCDETLYSQISSMRPLPYETGHPELRSILAQPLLSLTNEIFSQFCPIEDYKRWVLKHHHQEQPAGQGALYYLPPEMHRCVGTSSLSTNPHQYFVGFVDGKVIATLRDNIKEGDEPSGGIRAEFFHPLSEYQTHFVLRKTDQLGAYVPILTDIVNGIWQVAETQGFPRLNPLDLPEGFFVHSTQKPTIEN